MEYIPQGNLNQYIDSFKGKVPSELVADLSNQLLLGIE